MAMSRLRHDGDGVRVLLLQLDGRLPNVALMRIAAHHRALGDQVELRKIGNARAVSRRFGDEFDRVYASLIFVSTRPVADAVRREYPGGDMEDFADGPLIEVGARRRTEVDEP
jgi:hypothetical protein